MRIALYQPDIPQNTGAILRLGACLGVGVEIIEPCGFVLDDKRLARVGMDYLDAVTITRHASWAHFMSARERGPEQGKSGGRLVLLSTAAKASYTEFEYARDDVLLVGRESAGVPDQVRAATDAGVRVPMAAGTRSLNVALAAAMVLGEALRQTASWPKGSP